METKEPMLCYATVRQGRSRDAKLPSRILAITSLSFSAVFYVAYALLYVDWLHQARMNVPMDLEPVLPYPLIVGFALSLISRMITGADLLISSLALLASVYALFVNAFGFDFMKGFGF